MKQTTEELTNEIACSADLEHWAVEKEDSIDEITLADYLKRMLKQYQSTKKEIISRAQLDTTYGYQIFQGIKHPTREILLHLAFGFPLTVDETKRLLYYGNAGTLYPRVKRDAYIMYALHQHYSINQANDYLFEHDEQTLSK